jgi:hypothetical protein
MDRVAGEYVGLTLSVPPRSLMTRFSMAATSQMARPSATAWVARKMPVAALSSLSLHSSKHGDAATARPPHAIPMRTNIPTKPRPVWPTLQLATEGPKMTPLDAMT